MELMQIPVISNYHQPLPGNLLPPIGKLPTIGKLTKGAKGFSSRGLWISWQLEFHPYLRKPLWFCTYNYLQCSQFNQIILADLIQVDLTLKSLFAWILESYFAWILASYFAWILASYLAWISKFLFAWILESNYAQILVSFFGFQHPSLVFSSLSIISSQSHSVLVLDTFIRLSGT